MSLRCYGKGFYCNNIQNEVKNEQFHKPEREFNDFKANKIEVQDISTSYLEDDDDYVPLTQRDTKASQQHQSYDRKSYKISPMNRNSSSTQNLINKNDLNGKVRNNSTLKLKVIDY